MSEFISEDDLNTFGGWLRYQAVDVPNTPPDQMAMFRRDFDAVRDRSLGSPKIGLMKLRPIPGEWRYAVAVREGSDLWLTYWVRRSRRGEYFLMVPRADPGWDPHSSYHRDGTFHTKSYGHKFAPKKLQPLTGTFRGTEHLGQAGGHGPKSVGAICDPTAFNGILEVPPGVLGPRNGGVIVDLVEPGCEPMSVPNTVVQEKVFRETVPWIVIRIHS